MEFIFLLGVIVAAAFIRDATRETEDSNEHDDVEGSGVHRGDFAGDAGNRRSGDPGTLPSVGDVKTEKFSIVQTPPENSPPTPVVPEAVKTT